MGPKAKPQTAKEKQSAIPKKDADESVTEVEKEFFEFTLSEIEKKLNRIDTREEELKARSAEIEEKIEEHKKEKGVIITEHEQLLASKEEEKLQKQNEMNQLLDKIKNRKEICKDWKEKYEIMVKKYKEQIEVQEEEIQELEHFKQNKDVLFKQLDEMEVQMEEVEVQHKRNLYGIKKLRSDETVMRIKRETQSLILQFSTEFRKTSQKKMGKPCHRATAENKAIKNLLIQMQEEMLEYEEKCKNSKKSMIECKNQRNTEQLEKDKTIAKTVIQLYVIKALKSESVKLFEKLKTYDPIVVENNNLIKEFQNLSLEIKNRSNEIEETKKSTSNKIEETNATRTASNRLRKKVGSLQVLIRKALKTAEEAVLVRLIPIGKMEGEKYLPTDAKIRLFKKRRDSVFEKKGKILYYLLDILSKAQLKEDEKKLLKGSSESLTVDNINFSSIYGKAISTEDLQRLEGEKEAEKERKTMGPMIFTSLTSLPRSKSAIVIPEKVKSESASFEGELEMSELEVSELEEGELVQGELEEGELKEYGEYEEEEEEEEWE